MVRRSVGLSLLGLLKGTAAPSLVDPHRRRSRALEIRRFPQAREAETSRTLRSPHLGPRMWSSAPRSDRQGPWAASGEKGGPRSYRPVARDTVERLGLSELRAVARPDLLCRAGEPG